MTHSSSQTVARPDGLESMVARLVASAPPLSEAQRTRLRLLLKGSDPA